MLLRTLLASTALAALSIGASAADLPSAAPAPALVAPPAFTWAGFYIGGSLGGGYAWGTADYSGPNYWDTSYSANPVSTSKLLGLGGVQAGYNWQVGSAVFGAEADYNFLFGGAATAAGIWPDCNVTGTRSCVASVTQQLRATASLRARFGLDVYGTLLYGTAGVAGVDVENNMNVTNAAGVITKGGEFKANAWKPAFVVGGGVERMLTPSWSLRGEVLYYMIEKSTGLPQDLHYFDTTTPGVSYQNTLTVARIGLNYHF